MEQRADDRWREPIMLGIGAIHTQYASMAADRIETILGRLVNANERGRPKPAERWYRDLILAAEIGQERDWDLLRPLIDVEHIQDVLRTGLKALLGDRAQPLPVQERVRAGFLLGGIGDPRFPVTIEEWQNEIKAALVDGVTGGYLCRVPPASYVIGSTDDDPDADDYERPQHTFEVAEPFWIGRFPITNSQWQAWVEAGGEQSTFGTDSDLNAPNQPVTGVTWHQCVAFYHWLGDRLDVEIRLPDEQEWEAAARGGDARRYPWGDDWKPDYGATEEDGETRGWRWTIPTGCYPQGASPVGALDMAGNVWEWTAGGWHSYVGAAKPFHDEDSRVLRGGSYANNRIFVRCGARNWYHPGLDVNILGFRVVVAPRVRTDVLLPAS
ncbi:MAG: formylglycine-generating enzyme family protein [Herpetosiphonaceae bacterium]|nr:formylglycine-generating enzyme family protein [Herpetosiphonaceae bacterium]